MDGADRRGLRFAEALIIAFIGTVFVVFALSRLTWIGASGRTAAHLALVAPVAVLQLVHSLPRAARYSLPVQAAFTYVPYALFGHDWIGLPAFLAGSALILLRGRAGWALFAAVVASSPLFGGGYGGGPGGAAYALISTVNVSLLVYGFSYLGGLVTRVHATRDDLARLAVTGERLRAGGDVHDLLGYGLSAITLKGELAQRVLVDDPGRARAELAEVARLAQRTLGELRGLTEDAGELSLADEVASAREVLSGLGVAVDVVVRGEPPSGEAGTALAAVLREAVTNVLRHSTARRVGIRAAAGRLEVVNDGVGSPSGVPGTGLVSMAARVESLGGRLTACAGDGRFRLAAEVPPRDEPARAAAGARSEAGA